MLCLTPVPGIPTGELLREWGIISIPFVCFCIIFPFVGVEFLFDLVSLRADGTLRGCRFLHFPVGTPNFGGEQGRGTGMLCGVVLFVGEIFLLVGLRGEDFFAVLTT